MTMTNKKIAPSDPVARIQRVVRKTEAAEFDRKRDAIKERVDDVGTGQTIIKLRQAPLPFLIGKHKIASEELQAADEISLAFTALSGALMVKGISFDRVDCSRGTSDLPLRVAGAVSRYQDWAKVWSQRNASYCDPTLEIVIAAVIDERPIRAIAADMGFRVQKVEKAIINGLRDYAAHIGVVTGHHAQIWRDKAAAEFVPTPASIRLTAYARARIGE